MKEVILDTETTGLSVSEGHRIIEIGCIELVNQIPTENKFHCFINPKRKVSKEAFEVHGYTDDFLSNQKTFKEISKDFIEFIHGKKIIIHNAKFDIAFLNHELGLCNLEKIDNKKVVDTLELARAKFPGSQNNLDALCKRFKVDNSKRAKHSAMVDCELLLKVYINLIDQKEPKLHFSHPQEGHVEKNQNKQNVYFKKVVDVKEEEKILHTSFVKKEFKKNFF